MSQELINKNSFYNEGNIKGFFGDYRWLSNFHECKVAFEGDEYPSSENAYQAAKFLWADRAEFKFCSPKEAKDLGKNQKPAGWFNRNIDIMESILYDKFCYNRELKQKLLDTGNKYLEETNWWGDKFWGVCDGVGENMLGKLLMKVRDRLNYCNRV